MIAEEEAPASAGAPLAQQVPPPGPTGTPPQGEVPLTSFTPQQPVQGPTPSGFQTPDLGLGLSGGFGQTGTGYGTSGGPPAAGPAQLDPHTGAHMDVPGLLSSMSGDRRDREQLYYEPLRQSGGYYSAPDSVHDFLGERFNDLDAQYMAQVALTPQSGQVPRFDEFLAQPQEMPMDQRWRELMGEIRAILQGTSASNPLAAEILAEEGRGILEQALQANVHPAAQGAVGRTLGRRWAEYSDSRTGGASNQAAFMQEEMPRWGGFLGPR